MERLTPEKLVALLEKLRRLGVTKARFDNMDFEFEPRRIAEPVAKVEDEADEEDVLFHSTDAPALTLGRAEDEEPE